MHFDDSDERHLLAQHLQRDICMLYHELAQYSSIMGDLDYSTLYKLPYWNCITNSGLDWQLDSFICDGSLVMLLAMAWDCLDDSGSYLVSHLPDAEAAVSSASTTDDQTTRLLAVVGNALAIVSSGQPETDELRANSDWVHDRYVKGYFIRTAREFGKTTFDE